MASSTDATTDDLRPSSPSTELGDPFPPLPYDILPLILNHLVPKRDEYSWRNRRPTDLAHCCLVSSAFREIATPRLLRTLHIILPDRHSPLLGYNSDSDSDSDSGGDTRNGYVPMRVVAGLLTAKPELQRHPHTLIVANFDMEYEMNISGSTYPSQRILDSFLDFLRLLPALKSLELEDISYARILDGIAQALPEMPCRHTLTRLKLESYPFTTSCNGSVGRALRSLTQLRDLELSVPLDDSGLGLEGLPSGLSNLFVGSTGLSALPSLVLSSAATVRSLTIYFDWRWQAGAPTFLDALLRIEELALLDVGPQDLDLFLSYIPQTASLRSLVIFGQSSRTYPPLDFTARLSPSLSEITILFNYDPSDILALLQDTRFDGCTLRWSRSPGQRRKEPPRLAELKQATLERRKRLDRMREGSIGAGQETGSDEADDESFEGW